MTRFRSLLLGLAAILVLGLAACSKSEVPPAAPGTPTSAGVADPHDHDHDHEGHDHEGHDHGADDPHAGVPGAPPLATSRDTGEMPPGHPPVGMPGPAAQITPPPPGSGTGSTALVWDAPESWATEPPANPMRKAQYKVPGPAGDGECVVFYFGPGQGGDPMANAQRWASQFKLPDGSTAERTMKTSQMSVGDLKVLKVEVAGTYSPGMSMGTAPPEDKPGYKLLGAVAEGADANWFFRFTGPEKTVEANRAAFDAMLKSLRKGA